jgi:3-oxoacyl-[acyl-carrier protein] reductase
MKEKVVLITGASSGIGSELLRLFSLSGYKVYSVARSGEKLAEIKNEIIQQFPEANITNIEADISLEKSLDTIYKIISKETHIDILINNAGLLINKPFEEFNREDWNKIYNTNTASVYFLTQRLLPLLKSDSSNPTHIINISSMGGYQGSSKFPGLSAYSSSKAALANITECLAEELKEYTIKVNCIALGAVRTEMLKKAFPDYMGGADPQLIAEYIYDFATKAHYLMNGKIIPLSNSTP